MRYDGFYRIASLCPSHEVSKKKKKSRLNQPCIKVFACAKGILYQAYAANLSGSFLCWMNDMEDKRNKFTWESGIEFFRVTSYDGNFHDSIAFTKLIETESTILKLPRCLSSLMWCSTFCLSNVFHLPIKAVSVC